MNLNKIEKDNLEIIIQDVTLTIEKIYSQKEPLLLNFTLKLIPFFVILYFKILKHDAQNKDWHYRDEVFPMNKLFNLLKNILEIHSGYEKFENLTEYLNNNSYLQNRNSLEEIISEGPLSNKTFFVLFSQEEILNNSQISSLEYISKNKLSEIIIFIFVRPILKENFSQISQSGINFYQQEIDQPVIQDHKLNQKLNSLGFDVLVIDGSDMSAINESVSYAKSLKKPTVIFININ